MYGSLDYTLMMADEVHVANRILGVALALVCCRRTRTIIMEADKRVIEHVTCSEYEYVAKAFLTGTLPPKTTSYS